MCRRAVVMYALSPRASLSAIGAQVALILIQGIHSIDSERHVNRDLALLCNLNTLSGVCGLMQCINNAHIPQCIFNRQK